LNKHIIPKISPPLVGGEGREGGPKVFILSTPTPALPHRRGRGLSGRFEKSFDNVYRPYNYGLLSNWIGMMESGWEMFFGDMRYRNGPGLSSLKDRP